MNTGTISGKNAQTPTDRKIDVFDQDILEILSRDGRISITDPAERVGLSKSPCQVRVKKLREDGVIQGFRALLDPVVLGREHVAFVEVRLTDTTERALSAFNAAVRELFEIEQCHMIAGAFDYLLKVQSRDIRSYRKKPGRNHFVAALCRQHFHPCLNGSGER